MTTKSTFMARLLAAAAFAATMAPAHATVVSVDVPAAESDQLEDIVVTAEKRPTALQKTPISISVLSSVDLTNRHAQSLLDLTSGVPSLTVAPFFSRQSALIINIRGIGVLSDSNQPARDQGVGIYIDGVYQGRPQALGAALYDIEDIEVLKGPQGTLFGRNTEGGAVSIVTKRPSGKFRFDTTAGAGNYGSVKVQSHLDLPEFNNISLKFDAIYSRRNGLTKNPLVGASDFNSYNKRGFHGEIMWKPAPTFAVDYSYDISYDATTSLYQQQVSAGLGLAASATAPAILPFILAAATPVQAKRVDVAAVGTPEQPSVGKTQGHRLNLEWQVLPEIEIKSITAYRNLTQSQYDNGSIAASFNSNPTGNFTPNNALGVPTGTLFGRYSLANFRQNQFSEEVQAVGGTERLKVAIGALYYKENVQDDASAFFVNQFTNAIGSTYTILSLDPNRQLIQRASHVTTTSIGVYGQGMYTPPLLGDVLHLTVGGRFTRDKKSGSLFIVNGVAPSAPGLPANTPIPLEFASSRVDPLVNLAVDLSNDVHVYGKWSTGYRSGGANSRSLTYAPFKPETVSIFEAGAKTELFDHRVRLNVAAYTGTYKGIQLDFSGLYQQLVNGVLVQTTRTTTDTVNAPGTGRLRGVEAELTVRPFNHLTLNASYAYNKVTIPATRNPFPPSANGVLIPVPIPIYQVYTPSSSASGAVDYEIPLNNMVIRAHIDGNYDSGYYQGYTDSNYDPVTRAVTYAQPKGDAGLVFNGRLALADIGVGEGGGKLTLAVWARNLTNEQHLFYKSGAASQGISGFFNDQRTFGVEANIKF